MIDSISMKLVTQPQQFDVVVTTNQFGDILTDIGAGLVGGLGLAPGLCVGEKQAMAQATHGSAPDIAGRNIANPYAMIMSGQMLLAWLGRKHNEPKATAAADRILAAVNKVIADGKHLTRDLGGSASTQRDGRRHRAPADAHESRQRDIDNRSRTTGRTLQCEQRCIGKEVHAQSPESRGDAGARAASRRLPAPAFAQAWPQKPIKMIVPFPAGGGTDFIGRLAAKHLSERLGQQVYRREPRRRQRRDRPAGADAGRSRRLHHRDMRSDTPLVVNPWLYDKLPYSALRDFVPVGDHWCGFPACWRCIRRVPARSVAELIALAKAKPGGLSYASAGVGNFSHLAMELFALATGVKLLHVPYKGTGPASHGADRRRGADGVQQRPDPAAERQGRPDEGARRRRAAAHAGAARHADGGRDGAGLQHGALDRHHRAGQDAEGDRRAAQRRRRSPSCAIRRSSSCSNDQQVTPMRDRARRNSTDLIKKDLERWANVIKTRRHQGQSNDCRPDLGSSRRVAAMKLFMILLMSSLIVRSRLQHDARRHRSTTWRSPTSFSLPAGMTFGSTSGVAINSKGNIFVLHRGPHPLMEFDPRRQVHPLARRKGLFDRPHGLRIDREDNIWTTDVASHVVYKMNPEGRILLVLGVRGNAGDMHPYGHLRLFNEPNDMAFGPDGDIYVTQGHGRGEPKVRQVRQATAISSRPGARRATGRASSTSPTRSRSTPRASLYVADRNNQRIQVFDADGTYLRESQASGHAVRPVHQPRPAHLAGARARRAGDQARSRRQGAGRDRQARQGARPVRRSAFHRGERQAATSTSPTR